MQNGTVTAGARKSLGEYKPLLVWPASSAGKTTVIHQASEKYERGWTFNTREEAVACAARAISATRAQIVETAAKQARHPARVALFQKEFEAWGGQGRIEDAVAALGQVAP